MAEVQVKEEKGGKNKQKKKHLRVDFTPMVDMNMLLITFFMFCTTLLKPQTMNINMPTKDKPDPKQENKVRESTAITLLLGANDELYYYLGMIDSLTSYKDPNFLVASDYTPEGLRKLLLDKNKGTYEEIQELKVKLKNLEIKEEDFYEKTKVIQDNAMKVAKTAPTVMIKAADKSTYKNLVDALDEMLVCNIGAYAIVDMTDGDRYLLFTKTGNPDYLSDQQRAQNAASTTTAKK